MSIDTPVRKMGIVAILDALGVKNLTESDTEKFIRNSKDLVDIVIKMHEEMSAFTEDKPDSPPADVLLKAKKMDYMIFGDTIIIYWETETEDDVFVGSKKLRNMSLLESFSIRLRWLFIEALKKQIKLRGSISTGKFYVDENGLDKRILGPALSDAASWYEKAEWMGIIATPDCSKKMSCHFASNHLKHKEYLEHYYIEYPVPIKNIGRLNLWSVAWPMLLTGRPNPTAKEKHFNQKPQKYLINGKKEFWKIMKEIPIGPDMALKFDNTVEFFNSFLKV